VCPEFTRKQVSVLFGSIAVGKADEFAETRPSYGVFSNQTDIWKALDGKEGSMKQGELELLSFFPGPNEAINSSSVTDSKSFQ
jgi:hypothetical protein